jgi:hypothetical protein
MPAKHNRGRHDLRHPYIVKKQSQQRQQSSGQSRDGGIMALSAEIDEIARQRGYDRMTVDELYTIRENREMKRLALLLGIDDDLLQEFLDDKDIRMSVEHFREKTWLEYRALLYNHQMREGGSVDTAKFEQDFQDRRSRYEVYRKTWKGNQL